MLILKRVWPFISIFCIGIIACLPLHLGYKLLFIIILLLIGGAISNYIQNRDPVNKAIAAIMVKYISGFYQLSADEQSYRLSMFLNNLDELQKSVGEPRQLRHGLAMVESSLNRDEFAMLYALSKALKNTRTPADNNIEALMTIGTMYHQGNFISQSSTEALEFWLKAAEKGSAKAQVNIGSMYSRGEGVEQNFEEAYKWYLLAAEQGNSIGQLNVGSMYFYGEFMPIKLYRGI